jgi:hypothetical protein
MLPAQLVAVDPPPSKLGETRRADVVAVAGGNDPAQISETIVDRNSQLAGCMVVTRPRESKTARYSDI